MDHMVERAALMARGDVIRTEDLALRPLSESGRRLEDLTLDEVEAILIRKALDRFDRNVKQAANELGLSRSGLYRRLAKHGLTPRD